MREAPTADGSGGLVRSQDGLSVLEVLVVPVGVVVPVLVALRDLVEGVGRLLGRRVGPEAVLAAAPVRTLDRVVLQAEPVLSVVTHPPLLCRGRVLGSLTGCPLPWWLHPPLRQGRRTSRSPTPRGGAPHGAPRPRARHRRT